MPADKEKVKKAMGEFIADSGGSATALVGRTDVEAAPTESGPPAIVDSSPSTSSPEQHRHSLHDLLQKVDKKYNLGFYGRLPESDSGPSSLRAEFGKMLYVFGKTQGILPEDLRNKIAKFGYWNLLLYDDEKQRAFNELYERERQEKEKVAQKLLRNPIGKETKTESHWSAFLDQCRSIAESIGAPFKDKTPEDWKKLGLKTGKMGLKGAWYVVQGLPIFAPFSLSYKIASLGGKAAWGIYEMGKERTDQGVDVKEFYTTKGQEVLKKLAVYKNLISQIIPFLQGAKESVTSRNLSSIDKTITIVDVVLAAGLVGLAEKTGQKMGVFIVARAGMGILKKVGDRYMTNDNEENKKQWESVHQRMDTVMKLAATATTVLMVIQGSGSLMAGIGDKIEEIKDPLKDTDGDFLPDAWEKRHFGSIEATNGSVDSDRDGINNYDEYLRKTDPNKPDLPPMPVATPSPSATASATAVYVEPTRSAAVAPTLVPTVPVAPTETKYPTATPYVPPTAIPTHAPEIPTTTPTPTFNIIDRVDVTKDSVADFCAVDITGDGRPDVIYRLGADGSPIKDQPFQFQDVNGNGHLDKGDIIFYNKDINGVPTRIEIKVSKLDGRVPGLAAPLENGPIEMDIKDASGKVIGLGRDWDGDFSPDEVTFDGGNTWLMDVDGQGKFNDQVVERTLVSNQPDKVQSSLNGKIYEQTTDGKWQEVVNTPPATPDHFGHTTVLGPQGGIHGMVAEHILTNSGIDPDAPGADSFLGNMAGQVNHEFFKVAEKFKADNGSYPSWWNVQGGRPNVWAGEDLMSLAKRCSVDEKTISGIISLR